MKPATCIARSSRTAASFRRNLTFRPSWATQLGTGRATRFVVETAGFNDRTSLDGMGHPHSDALHLTERYHRRDFGHLDVEMTFDDPKFYTRPFTIKVPHDLVADNDIFEMFCENEKDRVHMVKP